MVKIKQGTISVRQCTEPAKEVIVGKTRIEEETNTQKAHPENNTTILYLIKAVNIIFGKSFFLPIHQTNLLSLAFEDDKCYY